METYRFRFCPGNSGSFLLNRRALATLGKPNLTRTVAAHGTRRMEVVIVPLEGEENVLPVPEGTARGLGLAADVPYRFHWSRGELRIGPVIGILAGKSSAQIDLSPGALTRYFLLRYPKVCGLVFVFGADDVDPETETIAGYHWIPNEAPEPLEATGAEWERADRLATRVSARAQAETPDLPPHPRTARFQTMSREFLKSTPTPESPGLGRLPTGLSAGRFAEGRYPFPGAIWRRAGFLTSHTLDLLVRRIGPGIFNSSFFDKEEGHRILTRHPDVRMHVPATQPLQHFQQLFDMTDSSGSAILKRSDGNSGYGLMRVERQSDGYTLRFRERRSSEHYPTRVELEDRLRQFVQNHTYLLQQCIDLPVFQGRPCDFRVMMNKDGRGQWEVGAIVGRFGQRGSIVTNFINDGFALPPDEALHCAFGAGHQEAYQMKQEIVRFAESVGRALDDSGGIFGDVGLDIALDRNRRLWLFEINKLPFHELLLYAGNSQAYLGTKSGPLLFASHLAGFGLA